MPNIVIPSSLDIGNPVLVGIKSMTNLSSFLKVVGWVETVRITKYLTNVNAPFYIK